MKYKQCLNCGNYFETSDTDKDSQYCSKDCYKEYIQCIVCGEYFEKDKTTKNDEPFVCSDECRKKYKYDRMSKQLTSE